ncbi:Uncharacterised protein [Mycobacteroides abscessus subsp. abscessus]|uniref:hypothetical protein n=1 Tax=Mycobacteroides abscessus TaxID=36809 RepID=UPI0009267340|nr:hypothetical protein [Mycobacteroides abscessus]SHU67059.1 Uncharacterised protein [Mycobacteroides abscessus subsp. abscessus]
MTDKANSADERNVTNPVQDRHKKLWTALGETAPAPTGHPSWEYAKEGQGFNIRERRVANRYLEAHISPSGDDYFSLGHLRAIVAAAADYDDDAFVRVNNISRYEIDELDGDEHWFNGVVIDETMASRRTDLMGWKIPHTDTEPKHA